MLKRIIKENLNTFETEQVLERLLKTNILVTPKKSGKGMIIKLVSGDKLISFDPENEIDLENLYDQLYPLITKILEKFYPQSNVLFNTKRRYDLVVKMVERIVNMFSGKQQVNQTELGKVLDKYLDSLNLNFNDGVYLKIDGRDLDGFSKGDIDSLVKKVTSREVIPTWLIHEFGDKYIKTFMDIFQKLHNDFGVSYREAKPSIIKTIDNIVKKRTGFSNLTNTLRKNGFNLD